MIRASADYDMAVTQGDDAYVVKDDRPAGEVAAVTTDVYSARHHGAAEDWGRFEAEIELANHLLELQRPLALGLGDSPTLEDAYTRRRGRMRCRRA